jgi:hypothetical protein
MKPKVAKLAPVVLAAALPLIVPAAGPVSAVASAQNDNDPPPLPEPVVHTIQEVGPPSERLNMVLLGDGYQWDQQSLFLEDVDRNLAVMWSVEPFRSYRHHINVYAVEIASIDYGLRRDPDGRVRHPDGTVRDTGEVEGPIDTKNTALRLWYSDGLTNPLARGTTYGPAPVDCQNYAEYYPDGVDPCETGNQARDRIMNDSVAPVLGIPAGAQNVQTLAIFNSFTYGGIGGVNATTSGGSPQGPLVSLHELGHSLGTSYPDEYPYSSRDVVRQCRTGGEPTQFNHTIYTSEDQMIADQHKWWRWLGEESESGGRIGLHEGGLTFPCGVRRPSEHSMMRWIGFYFDQVGREHMVARITGRRFDGTMALGNRPTGLVARDEVLWVDPVNPKFHELDVTWRVGGASGEVLDTDNARNLELADLDLEPGTVVHVEARDPVGPDGIDWVRNPSTGTTGDDSGYNGARFVQTREWTVSDASVAPTPPAEVTLVTNSSPTGPPVGGQEVVYVETGHPTDRVLEVSWELDGEPVPGSSDRTIDLSALGLPEGSYELTATVTDPAPGGDSTSLTWAVDNVLPTAPRTLSEPLTNLNGQLEHPVYFDGWDMSLAPQDDRTGYDEDLFVVGELRLNEDGWFNYFGFPEEEDAPFKFRHSGTDVKALTYGNLGTGGLSKATFEQYFEGHPSGTFVPGFGTHFVEHRAIDPVGNIGDADAYYATVLPGDVPACTRTVTGTHQGHLTVTSGVTCLEAAQVMGGVSVGAGASLVSFDSTINGRLTASGAEAVQLFGSQVNGTTQVSDTATGVWAAGTTFNGAVTLSGNDQVARDQGDERWDERFMQYGFEYGPILAGNRFNGGLGCEGNSAPARDFDAPNSISGYQKGDCADL